MRAADLTGQRFGLLTVIARNDKKQRVYFDCLCDCGNHKIVEAVNLRAGRVKSCGCLRKKSRAKDLSGRVFGKLTVISRAKNRQKSPHGPNTVTWRCLCACGQEAIVTAGCLMAGSTKSCGCLHQTHGASKTQTYKIWKVMRQRCRDVNAHGYEDYGGRGIRVCPQWEDFSVFLADMGEAPAGMSIDRIDNDGDYEPGNCRWATRKEQGNNKRNNRRIPYLGETKTLSQWSDVFHMNPKTLSDRLKRGFSVEEALTRPVRPRKAS